MTTRITRSGIAATIVLTLSLALGASPAAAASSPQVTGPGTGPQPAGVGLGSKAALAQKNCAPNGHTNFNLVGVGPFCVNPWPTGKDNGGATAQGVTSSTVKVVAYIPNDSMIAQGNVAQNPTNLATGKTGSPADAVKDWQALYDYATTQYGTFQLWGRKVDIQVVSASGDDEASQRADAVEVLARKPFLVYDLTNPPGARVFESLIAARKVVVYGPAVTASVAGKQSPYLWGAGADPLSISTIVARFLGRSLADGKAHWAGDPEIAKKARRFGLIYPAAEFDDAAFEATARQNGATIASKASFDPSVSANTQQEIPTIIGRLKAAGATSVVLFAGPLQLGSIFKAATDQGYFPEWIITGYQYSDFTLTGRGFDQKQMAHAFGLGVLYPYISDLTNDQNQFTWYWGPQAGTQWASAFSMMQTLYTALTYAGPRLTATNLQKGQFAAPAINGAATGTISSQSGFGKTVGLPFDMYSPLGSDATFIWWSADTVGPVQFAGIEGKGVFMYLDGAKRYGYKDLPNKEPGFFDKKSSVDEVPSSSQFPEGVVPAAQPCTGCPSAGGASS